MKIVIMTVAFTLEVPDDLDEQQLFMSLGRQQISDNISSITQKINTAELACLGYSTEGVIEVKVDG